MLLALLAKLSGHNKLEEIAAWAKAHRAGLVKLLELPYPKMPHAVTYSQVFGDKVVVAQLEQILGHYFTQKLGETTPTKGSLTISIDGKTLRGTIPNGQTSGQHLMAAYLPTQGLVLAQVPVGAKTNEITAAPKLLELLDLTGVVVTGDAMQAQRALSLQITEGQGDYLWLLKDNQKLLSEDVQALFQALPVPLGAGFSPPKTDFESYTHLDKGHGRLEKRTITVSSLLQNYQYWPKLGQVFKLEREWTIVKTGEVKCETRYGITSLRRKVAGPARLLAIAREEWGIENGLHYVRDVTFGEDYCQVKRGSAPQQG